MCSDFWLPLSFAHLTFPSGGFSAASTPAFLSHGQSFRIIRRLHSRVSQPEVFTYPFSFAYLIYWLIHWLICEVLYIEAVAFYSYVSILLFTSLVVGVNLGERGGLKSHAIEHQAIYALRVKRSPLSRVYNHKDKPHVSKTCFWGTWIITADTDSLLTWEGHKKHIPGTILCFEETEVTEKLLFSWSFLRST